MIKGSATESPVTPWWLPSFTGGRRGGAVAVADHTKVRAALEDRPPKGRAFIAVTDEDSKRLAPEIETEAARHSGSW